MAIEIEALENFGRSTATGICSGTVIVRFDGPIETMHINVLFKDRGSREKNKAAAVARAKRLAFRFQGHEQ
jgi:hypothetical protein